MAKDIYDFGICKNCGKDTAIKNGFCADCEKYDDLPNVFKDMFGDVDE